MTQSDMIETTITYLEMVDDPGHRAGPCPVKKTALLRTDNIPVHYYRYLYGTVGRDHIWYERQLMDDEMLSDIIHNEGIEITVAYVGGVPAGYFELDLSDLPTVDLAYFGLIPDFVSMGLGKWLLMTAIETAWDKGADRLTVNTCTLDSPRALPLYQKLGFTPYAQEHKEIEVPALQDG